MIFGNEDDETDLGDGNFSPDAGTSTSGCCDCAQKESAAAREGFYLIVVKVTDAAGNSSVTARR
jgi:hypothetical protein